MYEIALEILKKIKQHSFEAYIIGGYPRDLYLGKINKDIDICTNAKYEDLKSIFKEIQENKYGSYKIKYKDNEYEITTFRKEIGSIKNRYPKKIKYTKKLKKDLKRRDFIMNTLCINEKEEYVDLLGAKKDIDNKIIRLIGSKIKIEEDSLRILRAIRFATVLNFKIDRKLDKAIEKYKENLQNLSFDRKKQELEKILANKNIKYGIRLIKEYELEKYLSINIKDLVVTENINGIWAQILIDDSYNFTKKEKKEIELIKELKEKKFNQYNLYKYRKDIMQTVNEIRQEKKDIEKLYNELPIKDRDEIKIDFFEICEITNANNKNIDKIYENLEKQIVENKIKNTKQAIRKYLKEKFKKNPK